MQSACGRSLEELGVPFRFVEGYLQGLFKIFTNLVRICLIVYTTLPAFGTKNSC